MPDTTPAASKAAEMVAAFRELTDARIRDTLSVRAVTAWDRAYLACEALGDTAAVGYTPYTATLPDCRQVLISCFDGIPSEIAIRDDEHDIWGPPTVLTVAP